MPSLHGLLGGPLVLGTVKQDGILSLRPVDACLGVPGLPQSATGQTALFTGVNAPALVGDHVTAFPTTPLRRVIAEHSLLNRPPRPGRRSPLPTPILSATGPWSARASGVYRPRP